MHASLVVKNVETLLTMVPSLGEGPLGSLRDAAIAFSGDRVCWIGPTSQAPTATQTIDGTGCVALPGLVDCHTHAVWAGSRASEFRERVSGTPYTEILERGGGILSTVTATRAASAEGLIEGCTARLQVALGRGVTTMEIKSGYGLEPDTEVLLLRAAAEAGRRSGVRVRRTFLGAHAVPQEHRKDRSAYVAQVIEQQLPLAAPEADFIDAYVDRGAFTVEEGKAILIAGRDAGLKIKVHAEQVEYSGIAAVAAELGAVSADHLERIDHAGVQAMAKAGTVAVLLPGAMVYLHDTPPPVAALREAGVPMAIATDLNPGSSPVPDLWVCASLACVMMGLTIEEVLLGITAHAADALDEPDLGRLWVGGPGDLVLVRAPAGEPATPEALVQFMGGLRIATVVRAGQTVQCDT